MPTSLLLLLGLAAPSPAVAAPVALPTLLARAPLPASAPSSEQEPGDEEKQEETAKERAAKEKAAVAKLSAGLKSDQANERQGALIDAARTPYPKVVKALGEVIGDEDPQLGMIAAELLGRMEQEDAYEALRRCATREKKRLAKHPELLEEVIRGLGRHRDPRSAKMLIKGAFDDENRMVGRARVFAVANLRSKEAAAAIFGEMKKKDVRRLNGWIQPIRPALIHVTGKDVGKDPARWLQWWEANRRTFEVPEQPPRLTAEHAEQWARFWGEERTYERRKKRSDRG